MGDEWSGNLHYETHFSCLGFSEGLRNVRPNTSWRCHRMTQNPCRAFRAFCLPGSPHRPPCCPTSVSGWWQQRGRGGKPGGSGSRVTPPRAPTLPQRLARAGLRLTGWKRKPGISQPLCGMQIIIIIIKKNLTASQPSSWHASGL